MINILIVSKCNWKLNWRMWKKWSQTSFSYGVTGVYRMSKKALSSFIHTFENSLLLLRNGKSVLDDLPNTLYPPSIFSNRPLVTSCIYFIFHFVFPQFPNFKDQYSLLLAQPSSLHKTCIETEKTLTIMWHHKKPSKEVKMFLTRHTKKIFSPRISKSHSYMAPIKKGSLANMVYWMYFSTLEFRPAFREMWTFYYGSFGWMST